MSNKNLGVVWRVEPHTISKTEVLRAYLVAYFQILGTSKPQQTILYVDDFAGPDEYTNFPHGSPTAALIAAQEAITNRKGAGSPAKYIAPSLSQTRSGSKT